MFPLELRAGIYLDNFQEEDAEEYFQLINKNRIYLKKFLGWLNSCNSAKDTLAFIKNANHENNINKALTLCIKKTMPGNSLKPRKLEPNSIITPYFEVANEKTSISQANLIGVICFHPFQKETNSAGIGYWIDEASEGNGIITEACRFLIEYGFNKLNLSTITISCNIKNYKSQAVAKRLGFVRTKLLPKKEWLYDHYASHICHEISKDEWRKLLHNFP